MSRIAVIDDQDDVLRLVQVVLEFEGHAVFPFLDPVEFVESFEKGQFTLVVVDVSMPKMNGFEVVKAIREKDADVRIVMLTALGGQHSEVEGYEVGADLYLVKPFRPLMLSRAVWDLIEEEPDERVERLHRVMDRMRLLS